jgi:hypothetical protein
MKLICYVFIFNNININLRLKKIEEGNKISYIVISRFNKSIFSYLNSKIIHILNKFE